MAHADMAESIDNAFIGGDPVGERELGEQFGKFWH
jgi:hypothetical protein